MSQRARQGRPTTRATSPVPSRRRSPTSDCHDLLAEIARLEAEVRTRQADLEHLQDELRDLERAAGEGRPDVEAESSKLEDAIDALREQLNQAADTLTEAEKVAVEERSRVKETKASLQQAYGEYVAAQNALENTWKAYRNAGFSPLARCLVYADWYGDLSTADKWRKDVQRRFVRDILSDLATLSEETLEAAKKTCLDSAIVTAGRALTALGGLVTQITSWAVAVAKGTYDALMEAAVEQLVGESLQAAARYALGDRYNQEVARPLDLTRGEDVRTAIRFFLDAIRELEWLEQQAATRHAVALDKYAEATKALNSTERLVSMLRRKVESLEEALAECEGRLDALKEGVDNWRAETTKIVQSKRAAVSQADADLRTLIQLLQDLKEVYERQCPEGQQ